MGTVEASLDTNALWREFKRTNDRALRDRLILTYAPLVKYVAGRLGSGLPAHVEEGDLVSHGLLGLIGAIERFDPDRDIKCAIASLEGKLHRAPNDQEISTQLGISEEEFQESLLEISRSSIAALDELWAGSSGGDPVALIDTIEDPEAPEPQAAMAQTDLREALGEAIARLPEREKLVVTLYYYEELTLREIGEVLGVTESRGSQPHTKPTLRLKARLSGATPHAAVD